MRELTQRQSNQSKKAEIVKYYYWKEKGKEELHNFCQNTERDREDSCFGRVLQEWLVFEVKMDRRAFVSVNRMIAGHSSCKASWSSEMSTTILRSQQCFSVLY
jgi:hypothetical protein